MSTACPHGYWGYDLPVLRISHAGIDYLIHRYCISSSPLCIAFRGDTTQKYSAESNLLVYTIQKSRSMSLNSTKQIMRLYYQNNLVKQQ